MYKYDINASVKNGKELESLIETIRIFNQSIEMEFGIRKMRHA